MKVSEMVNKDHIWDVSKHHTKLSVSTFKVKGIEGHEIKKVKLKKGRG